MNQNECYTEPERMLKWFNANLNRHQLVNIIFVCNVWVCSICVFLDISTATNQRQTFYPCSAVNANKNLQCRLSHRIDSGMLSLHLHLLLQVFSKFNVTYFCNGMFPLLTRSHALPKTSLFFCNSTISAPDKV